MKKNAAAQAIRRKCSLPRLSSEAEKCIQKHKKMLYYTMYCWDFVMFFYLMKTMRDEIQSDK